MFEIRESHRSTSRFRQTLAHRTQLQRLKNALEIYYLEKGQYPGHLEELVSAHLLSEEDLFYRKGISFQYERKDGRYILKR